MVMMGFPMHRLITEHLTDKDCSHLFLNLQGTPSAVVHLQEMHGLAGNAEDSEAFSHNNPPNISESLNIHSLPQAMSVRSVAASWAIALSCVDPCAFSREASKKLKRCK